MSRPVPRLRRLSSSGHLCAACLGPRDEKDFFFAGVCRSKTVRTPGTLRLSNDKFMQLHLTTLPHVRRRRRGPECRRVLHALARRHGDGERSPKQPRSPRAPPLSSHRRHSRSQLLNTSANSVFAGDLVEWTLSYQMAQRGDTKRQRQPRPATRRDPNGYGLPRRR